jgi:hypothetical protein
MNLRPTMLALLIFGCTGASVYAAERPATKAEIEAKAVGHTINGRLWYAKNGRYTYEGRNPGRYTISNGKICIQFDNGRARCDKIVTDGKSYTLINKEGERYPWK